MPPCAKRLLAPLLLRPYLWEAISIMASYLLVAIQFICLGVIVLSRPAVSPGVLEALLVGLGLLLGLWALLTMRLSRLSVLPEVRADAQLITAGPYRLIRHPMYSSLLLVALGLTLAAPLPWRWLPMLILLVNMVLKLRYEEQLLARHFSTYAAYRRQTWRLVPWIY
jgi:protein-S-isoprenylcysteine O-methyltransferase Ste14